MKFLFCILFALAGLAVYAGDYTLTVNFSFKNIEEGYDHMNKVVVYIDGEKAGESTARLESSSNSVQVPISEGPHTVVVENWALYQGNWELHNTENNYSYDLVNKEDIVVKKNVKMTLVYDLDSGATVKIK